MERRMVGRVSIGHSDVTGPEGGGGATGIWFSSFSFLHKHALFQIFVFTSKTNKMMDATPC